MKPLMTPVDKPRNPLDWREVEAGECPPRLGLLLLKPLRERKALLGGTADHLHRNT
jgi:hypothetical protein